MAWDYLFDSAESEQDAKEILRRRDADGWEAIGYARQYGVIELMLRRRRSEQVTQRATSGVCGVRDSTVIDAD